MMSCTDTYTRLSLAFISQPLITVTISFYLTVFGYISRHTLQCYHIGLLVTSRAEIVLTCIFLALLHL